MITKPKRRRETQDLHDQENLAGARRRRRRVPPQHNITIQLDQATAPSGSPQWVDPPATHSRGVPDTTERAHDHTDQRCAVERARRLAPAADQDPEAVAKLLGCPSDTSTVYPYAFGSAMAQMRDLLAILDELATTSRAGRRAMTTPPHEYIPAGPVGTAPYLGYCPPEVRQEALPGSRCERSADWMRRQRFRCSPDYTRSLWAGCE
jgi:hypothetical protein